MEEVNFKVFKMIKGVNESKILSKHMVRNVARDENGTMISAKVKIKN